MNQYKNMSNISTKIYRCSSSKSPQISPHFFPKIPFQKIFKNNPRSFFDNLEQNTCECVGPFRKIYVRARQTEF